MIAQCQQCKHQAMFLNIHCNTIKKKGQRGPGLQMHHLETVASVLASRGTWTTYKQNCELQQLAVMSKATF